MVVTPNSRIRLLKTPIELDERNQLTFLNETAQRNYFLSLPYLEYDECSYQRKDNVIRYNTDPSGITYEDLIKYNYVMYQNTSYDDKWFYAFITNIRYVNDGMSEISIETDVIETWKFDIIYKPSFIEREHVPKTDDVRGRYLIPEGLETGEYISQFVTDYGLGTSHVVMASTVNPSDQTTIVSGGTYGNIYSGVHYYIFQSENDLDIALYNMADKGVAEGISCLFYCPDFITGYASATFDSNGIAEVGSSQGVLNSILVPLTPSTIDGYTPKNEKVFTYPYVAFVLSNNSGENMTYHLEDFIDSGNHLGEIKVRGTCTPGVSARAIPVNYRCGYNSLTNVDNNEYGLTMGKFPICSYPVDLYTNWVTQQGINPYVNIATAGLGMAGSGNLESGVNFLNTLYNEMHEVTLHSFVPMEARGNINSGDVTYTIGKLGFTGYMQTIKQEFAKAIDDYFSIFGYKVNRLAIPNFETRSNWNYIKTIGINITGDIPQNDMQKIKDIFNNGITFWHNPNTFLDYSQNNN